MSQTKAQLVGAVGPSTANNLTVTNGLEVTGVVTATSFSGSGAGLIGLANTAFINAEQVNVIGLVTATTFDGDVVGNITGVAATFSGNVSIGGTLTYEDVTSVDSVGLVTARSGIQFGLAGVGGSVSGTGNANFAGIVTATSLDASIAFWTLGASGTDHYTFTGPGDLSGDTDPDLQLIRGQKYIFKNRSGGHPFRIQSTPNGSAGTAYNDGVTNNDAGNGTDLIFDVPFDAPSILYYQCTAHSNMGGPIYVGSSSGDDVNVGAAITMYASSGIVSATSYYGDGSNLSGVESGVANFVASGTIPNGATVILNTDGTVGIITSTVSSTPQITVDKKFNDGASYNASAVYDSTNGKVVIAYRDSKNSNCGTAVVGTVSGTSITFGSSVVFNSGNTDDMSSTFDSTNGKVVIAYKDGGNSNYGVAIVGTVSGTSISFGTEVVFESANSTDYISSTFDSTNGKVVIAYRDGGNSLRGTAIVGTVSGTSISFGSATVFESATTLYISAIFDSTNNKVVIAYRDNGNSNYGTAIVGTVSGTSISFGSATVFESATTTYISATFDSTNGKVVIAYRDNGNSNYGTAIVGTVSGTSISFGSATVFESASTDYISATFDSTNGKVVISYRDVGNSSRGTAIVGTVSGTSISFGSEAVFNNENARDISVVYDSGTQQVVIAYTNSVTSVIQGRAVVFSTVTRTTNLTDGNYIGIAAEAISNGATGKITIVGGTNTGQTGLTVGKKYFVLPDGGGFTIGKISPVVVAGTSISATKIIVKG